MMKKLLLLIFTINACAQAPAIEWQKTFGGTEYEWPQSIQKTTDGGYIIAGATASNDGDVTTYKGGQHDCWVIKINETGIMQWQKTYGGSGDDVAFAVKQTTDGGYIVSGYTASSNGDVTTNHGLNDCWVFKIDSIGNLQWEKTFGGSNYEIAADVYQCNDGGYLIAGSTRSHDGDTTQNPAGFDFNSYIIKLNAEGIMEWQKFYGGTQDDTISSIQQSNDGSFIIAGMTASNDIDVYGNHGQFDYWIIKIDALGILLWQKTFGGTRNESATEIQCTVDGGFIIAGYAYSTDGNITGNHGDDDAWIVKLNAQGTIEWQKMYGGTSTDRAYGICQTSDGGYIFSGTTLSSNGDVTATHYGYEGWVVKIDATGNMQWNKSLGGYASDGANNILEVPEGGYIVAGDTQSSNGDVTSNHGLGDFWVIKLGPSQLSDHVFSKNDFSVYPNPVADLLYIQFQNGIGIDKICITDILGKTILEQSQNLNQINTQDLASGTYFLQATANNQTYQTKFIKQ